MAPRSVPPVPASNSGASGAPRTHAAEPSAPSKRPPRTRVDWTEVEEEVFLRKCLDMDIRNDVVQRHATLQARIQAVTTCIIEDDPNWRHTDSVKNVSKFRNFETKARQYSDKASQTGGGALQQPVHWDILHGLFGSRHTTNPVKVIDTLVKRTTDSVVRMRKNNGDSDEEQDVSEDDGEVQEVTNRSNEASGESGAIQEDEEPTAERGDEEQAKTRGRKRRRLSDNEFAEGLTITFRESVKQRMDAVQRAEVAAQERWFREQEMRREELRLRREEAEAQRQFERDKWRDEREYDMMKEQRERDKLALQKEMLQLEIERERILLEKMRHQHDLKNE